MANYQKTPLTAEFLAAELKATKLTVRKLREYGVYEETVKRV